MDTSSLFGGDTFASLDDDLIADVKRPSLVSISSDDSHDSSCRSHFNVDSDVLMNELDHQLNHNDNSFLRSSTPRGKQGNQNLGNYDKNCSLSKKGKRYSLTAFDDDSANSTYILNKSASLYDISAIQNFPSLRRESIMYSTETLQSNSGYTTKSKDSGFQRSTSCTSITTSNGFSKKYDHVPSKVKQYIQSIKHQEALNKMRKQLSYNSQKEKECLESSPISESIPVSKKELLHKVKELEEEIREKEDVIQLLAKDHTDLKLKYAAAENHIDDLRIKISCVNKKNVFSDDVVRLQKVKDRKATDTNVTPEKTLQSVVKFRNTCTPLFPSASRVMKSSSCKHVNEWNGRNIQKSASNIENTGLELKDTKYALNLPYDKNSFDKVHRWQESLVHLDDAYAGHISKQEYNIPHKLKESCKRRVRTNSDNYDENYVKRKENHDTINKQCYLHPKHSTKKVTQTSSPSRFYCKNGASRKKLERSVSFATYEDSVVSSLYDDDSSSSDSSSSVFIPRQERYRDFKQRLLNEKKSKKIPGMGLNSEVVRTCSAGNLNTFRSQNKRTVDVKNDFACSCNSCYSPNIKHSNTKQKPKCLKLEGDKSFKPNPIIKCKTVHFCEKITCELPSCKRCVPHSKSDFIGVKLNPYFSSRNENSQDQECSCLSALEKLKIQEKNTLEKFSERIIKHPKKNKEKDVTKRFSSHK